MQYNDPSLLEGIFLCLWDSEAVRLQSSQWKRNLLVFTSGVSLEIALLPHVASWLGYGSSWLFWLLTMLFLPLGVVGLYASKFGNDRFVEWLLVVPKFDLKP
jgi:hypothetical protein